MASLPSPTQVARDHLGLYDSWYKQLDPKNCGAIQAGSAAQFLKKSGLNDNILSRIWDLSDPGGKGYLDKSGLFAALKMVALAQNGKEPNINNINIVTPPPNMGDPPPHPPPPVAKSPGPPLVPAPPAPIQGNDLGVWTITPADRVRYDQIFNSLGPEANKIHGNKVRGVMLNSKLPMDILGKIWDHADMDKDGSLDKVEFSIAMHLIYKVLENNALPTTLPQEMLSSARRAGVAAQGPVPAPIAPPTQVQANSNEINKLQNSGPPPTPWVVSAADKSRYDVMFHNADLDKDGYVSGQEIKGVFLQSGLPQMVLAHIWNICDMKQTGKLTSEQFALAMWLIQQKIAGIDPPSTLTTEMIPPAMRPKPVGEAAQVVAKPIYSNPELQLIQDEIDEVGKDRLKLEADIQQKEASIRLKNNEAKNLQTELDTLTATFRQLENQKGAAQKKLDDLGQQLSVEEDKLNHVEEQLRLDSVEVETLRVQVEEQEVSLKSQEDEVLSKQKELDTLRNSELELENSILNCKKSMEHLANTQQETQLFISQAKAKMEELQEQEIHMTEVLTSFDVAISSEDASSLTEACLIDITPIFNDSSFMAIGPTSPKSVTSPLESPNAYPPTERNGLPNSAELNIQKGKDTSFIDGHDPFAQAFGGHQKQGDPFSSWDNRSASHQPPAKVDPFGGDVFAANKADVFGTEPFNANQDFAPSESPTPALPPKKSKQPPPRPAPPKTRPAKPPPPQKNSNNNIINDQFTGGWHDSSKTNASSKNSGFADFANFAEFDSKYSSTPSSSLRSPWGDDNSAKISSRRNNYMDPFEDAFGSSKNHHTSSNSPWPVNSPSSGFGSQNGNDLPLDSGDNYGSVDPFGGDYDPFKDATAIKEAEEFSWDDEQDGTFTDSVSDGSAAPPYAGLKDPFCLSSDDSPENKRNVLSGYREPKKTLLQPSNNARSKSALGDPLFSLEQIRKGIPLRSKTSLGSPGKLDMDFDPLSSAPKSEFASHKSNEDLLNENIFPSFNSTMPCTNINGDQSLGSPMNVFNNNLKMSSAASDPFASFQTSWTTSSNSRLEDECRRKRLEEQEKTDLEYAIALSRSHNHAKSIRSSRSPSTGL